MTYLLSRIGGDNRTCEATGETLWEALINFGPADLFSELKEDPTHIIDRAYVWRTGKSLYLAVYARTFGSDNKRHSDIYVATVLDAKLTAELKARLADGIVPGFEEGVFLLPWEDHEKGMESIKAEPFGVYAHIGRFFGLVNNIVYFHSKTTDAAPKYRSWGMHTYPEKPPESADLDVQDGDWLTKRYILPEVVRLLNARPHDDKLTNWALGSVCALANTIPFEVMGQLSHNLSETDAAIEWYMADNYFYHAGQVTALSFYREKRGLTFAELREKTGLSLSQLKQYEAAADSTLGRARRDTIQKLTDALNVAATDLVVNGKPVMRFPAWSMTETVSEG